MKLFVIFLYLVAIYIIGYIASRKVKTASGYLLGGRKLNAYTTALGAGASDMSGWIMMGLPGAVFLYGMSEIWLPVGLSIGAFLNWTFVAKKLRIYTQKYGDSLTIPGYLSKRFADDSGVLRIVTGVALLIFFTVYASAALVACAFLLEHLFSFDYTQSLYISAVIIMVYTSFGGFLAVNWIDVLQGTLMLFALLFVPGVIFLNVGGLGGIEQSIKTFNLNFTNPFAGGSYIEIISLLAWGFGYFGQPHILVRFMAAKRADDISKARTICMTWMVLSLLGAIAVGLLGSVLFAEVSLENPELVFLKSVDLLFNPWLVGLLFSAVLSAIMSTVSAQLLVASGALVEDVGLILHKVKMTDRARVMLNKGAVIVITIFAVLMANNPNSSILELVSHAWSGLGSAFGPLILFSLYWKKMNKLGAMLGIILGGSVSIIWQELPKCCEIFMLYEIIPGFIAGCLGVVVGSMIQNKYLKKLKG